MTQPTDYAGLAKKLEAINVSQITLGDIETITSAVKALRAAPSDGWRIPEGWKLVPIAPTEAMLSAEAYPMRKQLWDAMIQVAPAPPQANGEA